MTTTKEDLYNDALDAASHLANGGSNLKVKQEYNWLSVFDANDLNEFINEITLIINNPQSTVKELSDSILEWKYTANAIASVELYEALVDETDEVELTKPFNEERYNAFDNLWHPHSY